MKASATRLIHGEDLKSGLDAFVREMDFTAACILSAVGSLTSATIRFAGADQPVLVEGPLEIVSLSGTLGRDGSHLHVVVSDARGTVTGGHLKEGSPIRTTAEIAIAVLEGWEFTRQIDPTTGYHELGIRASPPDG